MRRFSCLVSLTIFDTQEVAYRKPDQPEGLFSGTKNKPGTGKEEKSASVESAVTIKQQQRQPPKYDYRKHPRYVPC